MERHRALASLIDRYCEGDGVHSTPLPRVGLIRMSSPTEEIHTLHQPALCIIAQGSKRVMVGDLVLTYDRAKYLVVSVDLPVIGQVLEASADAPYLCFRLDLDPTVLAGLLLEQPAAAVPAAATMAPGPGLSLGVCDPDIMDAVIRLLRLLDQPAHIPVLAPLVEREILYRLLCADGASRLRQIAMGESRLAQVNRAIDWIKRHYDQPFSGDAVADAAGMSVSALHEHFKAVTAMSPLQYQKQLRLQEARRLILAAAMDAATAGFRVGYESPSQFSREYRRLFGAPPLRDVARLRAAQGAGQGMVV
ncbi:AraC family transcriptional regulator [Niveispirillum irakense]|uniref:AraC family transcriptional regulator n=1 Tax=Niveispirillum irakense TaxID=34011 RepID=UPI00040BEB6C|nr:AraC family transcriptional regulator [Niveispirillum irakense]